MSKGISIIIAAYDRPRLLRSTIESVSSLSVPPKAKAEIIVVASPKMKEAPAIVEEANSRRQIPIRLVSELRPGLSHARNQGLQEAAYDHVAYFDDDVQVVPEWIGGYFDAIHQLAADCVVGPVSPVFEKPVPSYFPNAALKLITSPYSRRGGSPLVLSTEASHEVPGCNFGVRKDVALAIGGFNPSLGRSANALTGGDDFEFGCKLVAAGKKVVYQPACAVGHIISEEKFSKSWSRRRWYGLGIWQRFAYEERGSKHTTRLKIIGTFRIVKLAAAAFVLRVAGRQARAFECELNLLREAGFLLGTKNQ